MKRTAFCVTLTLCAIFLVGCAAQVQSKTQAPDSAPAELPQVRGTDNAAEAADTPLLPAEGKATETDAGVESSKSTPQTDDSADKAAEKQPASGKTVQPAVPEPQATSKQEPTPTPTPEPTPTPTPEPDPVPSAASGNIYSIAEAVRVGNEYAKAQYGVTIDTSMTTADSSYYRHRPDCGECQLLPRHGRQRGVAGGQRRAGGTKPRGAGQCGRHLPEFGSHGWRGCRQSLCTV